MSSAKLRYGLTVLAIAVSAGFLSCRDTGGEGEHFALSGKLFVFSYRDAKATMLVTLEPVRPMRAGQTAVATFEDPAGSEPIVVRQRIFPRSEKTTIESPPLYCVVKDKPYTISIAIEEADGAVVQTITTTLTSNLDQTVLPDLPLVVGPGYAPNPDLSDYPDGRLPANPILRRCPA